MPSRDPSSPTIKSPEEWLEKVAPEKAQGTFKLFLGYAPGVGPGYFGQPSTTLVTLGHLTFS